jgi:hypothetical protein
MMGVITTCLFLFVGFSLTTEGATRIGALVMALGVIRGVVLIRQVLALRTADEDEGEDQGEE